MKAIRLVLFVAGLAQLTLGFQGVADASETGQRDLEIKAVQLTNDSEKAWLGVEITTINDEFAKERDLSLTTGVYVEGVMENSPAEEAGLRAGDIILEFNNTKLTAADELIDLVAAGKAGDEVTLLLSRDGRKIKEVIKLGTWQDSGERKFHLRELSQDGDFFWKESGSSSYLGVSLETVDGQLAEYFGVSDGSAALVTDVSEGSPASAAGLKAGDVITEINDDPVESVSDVQRAIRASEVGETVTITALRERDKREFSATLAERKGDDRPFERLREFRFEAPERLHGEILRDSRHKPRMRGLFKGDADPHMLFFDLEDRDDDMRDLKKRLKRLERELQELKEKLAEQ